MSDNAPQPADALLAEIEALRRELAITRHHLQHLLEGPARPGTRGPDSDTVGQSGSAIGDNSSYRMLFSMNGPGGKPVQYYTVLEKRPWWRVALANPLKVERWMILRRIQRRRRRG